MLSELPLATQTTDGQFTSGLREIATALNVTIAPALSCQSFPQTMAAVRTGRFAAIVPELAVGDLDSRSAHKIAGEEMRPLAREAMLAWNPRLVRVRPNATRLSAVLSEALRV